MFGGWLGPEKTEAAAAADDDDDDNDDDDDDNYYDDYVAAAAVAAAAIKSAIKTVDRDMLFRVYREIDCRFNICRCD